MTSRLELAQGKVVTLLASAAALALYRRQRSSLPRIAKRKAL